MLTESPRRAQWVLLAKTETGKEIKMGRFYAEYQAREFAELYDIADWRIEGPKTETAAASV